MQRKKISLVVLKDSKQSFGQLCRAFIAKQMDCVKSSHRLIVRK